MSIMLFLYRVCECGGRLKEGSRNGIKEGEMREEERGVRGETRKFDRMPQIIRGRKRPSHHYSHVISSHN